MSTDKTPGEGSDEFRLSPEDEGFLRREDGIDDPRPGPSLEEARNDPTPGAMLEAVIRHNENAMLQQEKAKVERVGRSLKGCLPAAFVGAIGIIAVVLVLVGVGPFGDEDGDLLGTESPSATATESPSESPTETPGTDTAAAPSESDLPPGAMLFKGTSGGPIGCIPCDGQSRFLSLQRNGMVVGNAEMMSVATPWTLPGKITSFGARLSGPNKGRYGVNLFYPQTMEYGPGVSLEIGEQSAVYQWTPERDGTVKVGVPAVIIVGEGGNIAAEGTETLEWWFVFQPD